MRSRFSFFTLFCLFKILSPAVLAQEKTVVQTSSFDKKNIGKNQPIETFELLEQQASSSGTSIQYLADTLNTFRNRQFNQIENKIDSLQNRLA